MGPGNRTGIHRTTAPAEVGRVTLRTLEPERLTPLFSPGFRPAESGTALPDSPPATNRQRRLSHLREIPQIGLGPSGPRATAADQLRAVMSIEKVAVKQTTVLGNELIEGLGVTLRAVEFHEVHPAARDRLVVLVGRAVRARDLPDGTGHGSLGLIRLIQLQVTPRQLQMLSMAEAAPRVEDRAKDVEVLVAHSCLDSLSRALEHESTGI
jgi:hypothetical protein